MNGARQKKMFLWEGKEEKVTAEEIDPLFSPSSGEMRT